MQTKIWRKENVCAQMATKTIQETLFIKVSTLLGCFVTTDQDGPTENEHRSSHEPFQEELSHTLEQSEICHHL